LMPRISGLLMSDHGVWAARLCSDPINGWGWLMGLTDGIGG